MYLTEKENKTYETIDKVIKGTISRKEAMCELHRSRQQIYRLIKIYKQCGKDGFIHKGRGKISPNKKDARMIEELEQLYLTEYYDYNFEAFFEEIKYKRNIAYDTMLKHFTADDIISPLAHKKTIKVYNEKNILKYNGIELDFLNDIEKKLFAHKMSMMDINSLVMLE